MVVGLDFGSATHIRNKAAPLPSFDVAHVLCACSPEQPFCLPQQRHHFKVEIVEPFGRSLQGRCCTSRPATPCARACALPGDAEAIGRLTFESVGQFHARRGFAPDFPFVEAAVGLARTLIAVSNTFGTWGSALTHHLFIHMIIPGGACREPARGESSAAPGSSCMCGFCRGCFDACFCRG